MIRSQLRGFSGEGALLSRRTGSILCGPDTPPERVRALPPRARLTQASRTAFAKRLPNGCANQIHPQQHFSGAIAVPNKPRRRTPTLAAFGSAHTNGSALELCGPANSLFFPLARVVRHTDAPSGVAFGPMSAGSAF